MLNDRPQLAALFDLDGVISDTASVHAQAWRIVFDRVLTHLGHTGSTFDEKRDYELYVDGKMRQTGIEDFLASRGIKLPLGDLAATGLKTVNGIGNSKNAMFRDLIATNGVRIFDDSIRLIERLKAADIEMGIASSSKNARRVLEKSALLINFKAIMDGLVAEQDGIRSKPYPEFYVHAARLIGYAPDRCIVIEDALSGIASARQAGVKLVVAISRGNTADALRASGADMVVTSLDDVPTDLFAEPQG